MSEGIAITHKVVTESADSITIGAPSQGQIKVFGDFDEPDKFKQKIAAAKKLLEENRPKKE